MSGLFRQRAVAHASATPGGDLLRLSPAWTRWAYWLIVAGACAALLYCALARVDEWAEGPALIHVAGTVEVTAKSAGTVASIAVEPGQEVTAGAVLATLTADTERAQLARIEQEFNLQLARSLRDPADQGARQSLVTLRVERELAQARLAERTLRAPSAGSVEDIHARPGQAVSPGDQIVTLGGTRRTCSVWAMLPGRYRPELQYGAEVRFNVHGYRYAQARTELTSVGAQVLGPREVGRYLGQEIADALSLSGSTVIAKADLPSCSFATDDAEFRFHQGMGGTALVRVRSDALWAVLFPDLRKVFTWTP